MRLNNIIKMVNLIFHSCDSFACSLISYYCDAVSCLGHGHGHARVYCKEAI